MEWFWWLIYVPTSTSLIIFCRHRGYKRGYEAGAKMVLEEWKDVMGTYKDADDPNNIELERDEWNKMRGGE